MAFSDGWDVMRKILLFRSLVASILIAGLALTAPVTRGESATVKIVSSLPMKGASGSEAESIDKAIHMALEETGYRVGNTTVRYEALDDTAPGTGTWDEHREVQIAQQAVGDPDVMAYIGPFSSAAARHVLPILNRAHLVAVSPTASYPGLTRAVPGAMPDEPAVYSPTGLGSFARTIPPDDQQAVVAAAWAAQLGVSRAAVVDDGSPRGGRLSASFVGAARRFGIDVVSGPHGIDRRAADYRAMAEQIRTSSPGLIYFAGATQNHASRFVRDVRATVGPSVTIMGTDWVYNQRFLDEAGQDGDGIYVTVNGLPPGALMDRGAAWYAAYRARFQEEPGIYAVYAYEAARMLLDGFSRAGVKDREAIRGPVLATRDFDGLLGTFSFDPQGDPTIVEMSGRRIAGDSFDDQHAVILDPSATAQEER